jgi:hypothetical protein
MLTKVGASTRYGYLANYASLTTKAVLPNSTIDFKKILELACYTMSIYVIFYARTTLFYGHI